MLYNPKWKAPKPDVNSFDGLIAWLTSKDPDESYDYYDHRKCMCAQYYRAQGYWFVWMGASHFIHALHKRVDLPEGFNCVAYGNSFGHTFGAALARAYEMKALFDKLDAEVAANTITAAPTVYRTTCA